MLNFKEIFESLLPQPCVLCETASVHDIAFCKYCLNDLPWHTSKSCMQCGLVANNLICGNCIKEPPYFDKTYALFDYAYPADRMLQHYKYNHALHLSQSFGQLLGEKLLGKPIDLIIPMPLHPIRLQERGFNQSLEIAKVVAKFANIPLAPNICQKIKNTPPQASLKLKDRIKNIKGAFNCSEKLSGKRIALIDDVMTTGTSLNELAKTVKKNGAVEVSCFVLARTL
jgi:ComF family protein